MSQPDQNSRTLTGRCACRTVEYRVSDAFEYALNCHCSVCRRATGSAFKAFGGIRHELFEVLSGADQLMIVGDPGDHDARCSECGSYLYSVVRGGRYVHVTYGTLADAPTLRPTGHIFVGSKADWFDITDDLPQYERYAL